MPPMPTSITRTPSGTPSASRRWTTATPKPSSPRRTFPTPATRTFTSMRIGVMDSIAELEDRLARYPAERYTVQHATAQFHLGVELTNAGRAEEAVRALERAVALFDSDGLRTERAKARNALGAALRLAGRLDEASDAFRAAAADLEGAERGAALYNLGLARRAAGDPASAHAAFEQARALLDSPAVVRELGVTLLEQGELE